MPLLWLNHVKSSHDMYFHDCKLLLNNKYELINILMKKNFIMLRELKE